MAGLGTLLQVILAIALVMILFVIGFSIYNMEALRAIQDAGKTRKKVAVFDGVKDFGFAYNEVYNTSDRKSPAYIPITPSVNQLSGIEYTYNFWLYMDTKAMGLTAKPATTSNAVETDDSLSTDSTILFLRGDKTLYDYNNICGKSKRNVMIKGPLVKFERNMDVLTVEFNTNETPDVSRAAAANRCTDTSNDWEYKNAHKISVKNILGTTNLQKKWFMVTVVIQDTNPEDPLPLRNKARCRVYLNGTLELDRYVDGKLDSNSNSKQVIRENMSDLHVFPKITLGSSTTNLKPAANSQNQLMMADLHHYNYALLQGEIKSIYEKGFNKQNAPSISDRAAKSQGDMTYLENKSLSIDKPQLSIV